MCRWVSDIFCNILAEYDKAKTIYENCHDSIQRKEAEPEDILVAARSLGQMIAYANAEKITFESTEIWDELTELLSRKAIPEIMYSISSSSDID